MIEQPRKRSNDHPSRIFTMIRSDIRFLVASLTCIAASISGGMAKADGITIDSPLGGPIPMCAFAAPATPFNVSGHVAFSGKTAASTGVSVTFQRVNPTTGAAIGAPVVATDTVTNAPPGKTNWTVVFTPGSPPVGTTWYYKITAFPTLAGVRNQAATESSDTTAVQTHS